MIKKGPKTQAEYMTESARIPGAREPAPQDLEPAEAVYWNAIVIRLPADWFTSETVPLLKAYCRHANYADRFAADIAEQRAFLDAIEADVAAGRAGIRKLPKLRDTLYTLHKMHAHETANAMMVATKLRLTNQSRYVPDKAASKARSAQPVGPPPWHDWGVHASNSEN
jgi:hypothetical protein